MGKSCLSRASHDEPLLVLRANDELAPQAVRTWAHWYIGSKGDGAATEAQRAKFYEALQIADDMEAWRNRVRALDVKTPVAGEPLPKNT